MSSSSSMTAPLGFDGDPSSTQAGPRIGVVEVKGTIGDGQGGADGDKLVKLIRKYDKDDDIKAVVVRIDSPGGAVAPSQEVYSALRTLRKKWGLTQKELASLVPRCRRNRSPS